MIVSTMREVAALAGVSAKTVSRVMNHDRYVSDHVRGRVEQAIAQLQYVPNVLARTFRSGRDAAIGVAVPDISDPFFATVIHSVEQVARSHGAAVLISSLSNDPGQERAGVEALLGRQVAGLISTPVSADQSYLRPWQPRTAMVFIDRTPSKLTADSVVEDDSGGSRAATGHLLEHGHRRIGFVGETLAIATTGRRLDGYRAALAESGLGEDRELVVLDVAASAGAQAAIEHLLALSQPPTAIFASNARCAMWIVPALQRTARTDLAMISFGDFPLAGSLDPALTVVDQDPEAVGTIAAERLFERLEHPDRRLKRKIVLPVDLVLRDSCCGDSRPPRGRPPAPDSCRRGGYRYVSMTVLRKST
jgi:LacI family transcriptional regulator